ncbi:SPOR domain-containing protein [Marinomonas epiphytica]
MIDKTIKYRLAGAAILVLSACILLPLVLDGERPAELDLQVVINEPPAFTPAPIAKAEPVNKAPNTASPSASNNDEDDIQLIPIASDTSKQDSSSKKPTNVSSKATTPSTTTTKPAVKKPAAVSQKKPAGRWALQIATFKNRENAQRLVTKLQAAKYDAYSVTVNALYKVYVGPEFDREVSEKAKEKIKKDFGLNGFIIKYSVNG